MSKQQPVQVGDKVRDTKWGGQYEGTVTRKFSNGDVGIRWAGHLAEDQMSTGEYEPHNR